MKLVTYNVHFGQWKDERYDLSRIADEVSGADQAALPEVSRLSVWRLRRTPVEKSAPARYWSAL